MSYETESEFKQCIVKGCNYPGVCIDNKNYTQQRSGIVPDIIAALVSAEADLPGREIWYCREHAADILFPIIDVVSGNTIHHILQEFRTEELY